MPDGRITEAGLRHNIDVGIQYMASWLGGNGCVPIYNLMEDAATAEISRTQIWQWVHHPNAFLEDGRKVDAAMVTDMFADQMKRIEQKLGTAAFAGGRFELARDLMEGIVLRDQFTEFLTSVGYEYLD